MVRMVLYLIFDVNVYRPRPLSTTDRPLGVSAFLGGFLARAKFFNRMLGLISRGGPHRAKMEIVRCTLFFVCVYALRSFYYYTTNIWNSIWSERRMLLSYIRTAN